MSSFQDTVDYLYALRNRGSRYGIERMQLLVEALGHPERQFRSIHVAGTNGKGSTCVMLEALYRSSGYKVGFFNSPHLTHLGERIQINRQPLSEEEIVGFVEQLRPVAEEIAKQDAELHPTFFEFMAAMAFLKFAQEGVDLACIETGLGGRLDATNVVDPEVSVITSISLDHTELLGDTVELIAREKAGIIKPGKPVVIGRLPQAAEDVIREVAELNESKLYRVEDSYPSFDDLPQTNLIGDYQRWNAGLASVVAKVLQDTIRVKSSDALSSLNWHGRWQVVSFLDRTLILDTSHNPEGIEELAKNLDRLIEESGERPTIVAGALGLDRGKALMNTIGSRADEIYLVQPNQERASDPVEIQRFLPSGVKSSVASIAELFAPERNSRFESSGPTIVVTGSIYLVGEVLSVLSANGRSLGPGIQDRI